MTALSNHSTASSAKNVFITSIYIAFFLEFYEYLLVSLSHYNLLTCHITTVTVVVLLYCNKRTTLRPKNFGLFSRAVISLSAFWRESNLTHVTWISCDSKVGKYGGAIILWYSFVSRLKMYINSLEDLCFNSNLKGQHLQCGRLRSKVDLMETFRSVVLLVGKTWSVWLVWPRKQPECCCYSCHGSSRHNAVHYREFRLRSYMTVLAAPSPADTQLWTIITIFLNICVI